MRRSARYAILTVALTLPFGCAHGRRTAEGESSGKTVLAAHSEPADEEFPWAGGEAGSDREKPRERAMPDVLDVGEPRPLPDAFANDERFTPQVEPVRRSRDSEDLTTSLQNTGPAAFQSPRAPLPGTVHVEGAASSALDDGPRTASAQLPPPAPADAFGGPRRMHVPLEPGNGPRMDLTTKGDRISLVVNDAPVGKVLALIAQQQGLNVITSETIDKQVSVNLQDVRLDQLLSTLLSIAGYTWVRQDEIIVVTPITSETRLAPQLQGRVVKVFQLDFVAAVDVEKVVQGLLSNVGSAQIVESSNLDKRRTREAIVVEDLPQYVARVEEYVRGIDVPPRQVLIEAYILQVELTDNLRHGVNFEYLTQIAGSDVSLSTVGFANPLARPAFFLQIDGGELDALLEALKSTTEVRTLASPKVLAVNGQDSRIQIGQRLGYFVTTTTETSTLQNVDFLDLGVVLTVTPTIGLDNRILMNVRPQVSSGQINPETGLPEEDTTEVESTVMLDDGQAMIIGGLIQEEDLESQQKIPLIGDLRYIGRLFQRRTMNRRRSEVIVCLVPRIVPLCGPVAARELHQIERATSPVVTPDLRRARRDFEPLLPDATRNPRRLELSRIPDAACNLFEPIPHPPEYYFPRVFGPAYETSLPMEP